ncbi:MAG: hypothetical protein PHX08_05075 [Lachnospiraceae bacterium]|nr:hypothetical protein [Lachnospiraceae bacterium]
MNCSCCGGKMTKLKYLHYEEIETYLMSEYVQGDIENYKDWLMSLHENDLILTRFRKEEDRGIKDKYYLRLIEKKTKNGIKLKKLSKIFKYEDGKVIYENKVGDFSSRATYTILPINIQVDIIIRDYCKNNEKFDIDKLNKIITSLLSQKL